MKTRLALMLMRHKAVAVGVYLVVAWPASAALESGPYETVAGATVEERGDVVPNRSRIVPWFATFTFDFSSNQPSLTALITNAVLEGGDPFALRVRSSSGVRLVDGTYRFMGDYLGDVYPSGTQYGFDWRFAMSSNGGVVWNGGIGWWGGHYWVVGISNIALVAAPSLNIALVGNSSFEISWATNFSEHFLESAMSIPSTEWSSVTNAVSQASGRFSVTVDVSASAAFYRLRRKN